MTTTFFRQFARRSVVRARSPRVPAGETEYQYAPLENCEYIRIIHLFPSEDKNSDLRCAITVHPRKTTPSYEAISYVPGEQILTHTLKSAEGTVKITSSLAQALRHFRLPNQDRRLWADAVSINQLDDEEKSHQVGSMDEIYRKAIKILVWLDGGSEDAHLSLQAI